MITLYLFLIGVGAVGALAYMLLFLSHVPGAKDERLGKLEDLPPHLGEWVSVPDRNEDGLLCEQRHLLEESSGLGGQKLLLQVRFRDPETREIARVMPEQVIKRRRHKN